MKVPMVISVVLAIATSLVTWWPASETAAPVVDRRGELLNRGGAVVAPPSVTSLEVVRWDPDAKTPKMFQVAQKGGNWIIPSHFDYPADGGTRVGETAGSVLNVPRGPMVTDDPKRHAELGVVDPLREGTADADGRGERVTLKDAGGALLVDLIVGKQAEHADVRYVRDASEDAVFTAAVKADIQTAFKEWVETDLLKIDEADIRTLTVDDHSVDEEQGVVESRGQVALTKAESTGGGSDAEEGGEEDDAWVADATPDGKVVDQELVQGMLDEITGLKLAGVRPYASAWLQSRGFYQLQDGSLRGNEGAIQIGTRTGLIYFLFFGEIALGDEEDTAAEVAPSDTPREGHNRYMAVFVRYDPSRDEDRKPDGDGNAAATVTKGQEKALRIEQRFQTFFYVIDDGSFGKLKPQIDALFADPEPETDGEDGGESPIDLPDIHPEGEPGPDGSDAGEDAPGDGTDQPSGDDEPAPADPTGDEPGGDDPAGDDPAPPPEPAPDEPVPDDPK